METKELESCLKIIGYWSNHDETVIDEMISTKTDIVKQFVKPFSKEINYNLLNKDTIESKKDLMKYYVFEFFELQGFFKAFNEILFTGSITNYTPTFYSHKNKKGIVRKLNKFENYAVNCHQLFGMLFDEIQLCCNKYNIDFFKLCDELSFSYEYIDCSITLIFENERLKKKNLTALVAEKQPNKNKVKTSYKWQGNPDELPKLYKLMIDKYKLIGPETTLEQFEAVFTGQPIDEIDEIDKIERTKKFTNVLLTYFVSELFQKSNPNDYLSIAESCFDGAKNLSQAQTNYINNLNRLPKNHSLIDDLLLDLKKPL